MRKAIIPYFDLCTGCRICELVCSMVKFHAFAPRLSHITVTLESEGLRSQPHVCEQCEDPPCWRVCPVDAFKRDKTTKAVVIITEKCTGCRQCIIACPVKAIRFDENVQKAIKCDLCGGNPQCVRYCPTHALEMK